MTFPVTCWALIPVKGPDGGKSRLAGALDAGERRALAGAMLAHVVAAALQASAISRVWLVGPSRCGIGEDIELLPDPGAGLNPAVQSAFATLAGEGPDRIVPDRIIIVHGDLPHVSPQDLDLLAAAPVGTVAIAPDRHGTGTNALSLPLPAARDFRFAFGVGSCALHTAEAQRLGLRLETIVSQGLEIDIDEPEDLPDAGPMIAERGL